MGMRAAEDHAASVLASQPLASLEMSLKRWHPPMQKAREEELVGVPWRHSGPSSRKVQWRRERLKRWQGWSPSHFPTQVTGSMHSSCLESLYIESIWWAQHLGTLSDNKNGIMWEKFPNLGGGGLTQTHSIFFTAFSNSGAYKMA